ncbi:MAG: glutamine synthetase beta-grasp domain-containing protein [candidate division WOR-3 bacterium]
MINLKGVEFIDLKYVDLLGNLRHVTLPVSYWSQAQKYGIGFDGSSLKGFKRTERSDLILIPDETTTFLDPFYSSKTLSVFGNIYYPDSKTRYERDPKFILEKTVRLIQNELNVDRILFLPELEFYVFAQVEIRTADNNLGVKLVADENSLASGSGYHRLPPFDVYAEHRNNLVKLLQASGIEVKYHHHEGGALSQMEIETTFTDAEKTAQNIVLIKYFVKNYFYRLGKFATFMPKPLNNHPGSGMHFHHRLEKNGKSLFKGKKDEISLLGQHYINGVLSHLASLCAFTNPTTNSYKRLTGSFETPKSASIGIADRTSAIRIPGYAQNLMSLEFRVSDATCNPYLVLSAFLLAGLDGIRKKGNLKLSNLPENLAEAQINLKNDHQYLLVNNIFPKELIDFWIETKLQEYQEIKNSTHPLEYQHYFHF